LDQALILEARWEEEEEEEEEEKDKAQNT